MDLAPGPLNLIGDELVSSLGKACVAGKWGLKALENLPNATPDVVKCCFGEPLMASDSDSCHIRPALTKRQ